MCHVFTVSYLFQNGLELYNRCSVCDMSEGWKDQMLKWAMVLSNCQANVWNAVKRKDVSINWSGENKLGYAKVNVGRGGLYRLRYTWSFQSVFSNDIPQNVHENTLMQRRLMSEKGSNGILASQSDQQSCDWKAPNSILSFVLFQQTLCVAQQTFAAMSLSKTLDPVWLM